jgi:hydrogenase maturation protease
MTVPPITVDEPRGARGRPALRGVLVAGVGNVLRGDDGVGVLALQLLQSRMGARDNLRFYESGIAGVGLVQQLMDGYDALIILDAVDRNAVPGTVFVIEPTVERGVGAATIDLHLADPRGALRMADALGVRPKRVWIIGCQIKECDELGAELSPAVAKALPEVVRRAHALVDTLLSQTRQDYVHH